MPAHPGLTEYPAVRNGAHAQDRADVRQYRALHQPLQDVVLALFNFESSFQLDEDVVARLVSCLIECLIGLNEFNVLCNIPLFPHCLKPPLVKPTLSLSPDKFQMKLP